MTAHAANYLRDSPGIFCDAGVAISFGFSSAARYRGSAGFSFIFLGRSEPSAARKQENRGAGDRRKNSLSSVSVFSRLPAEFVKAVRHGKDLFRRSDRDARSD